MSGDAWLEDDRIDGAVDSALLGWLLAYARPEWKALAGCVVLLLILAMLELLQPFLIKEAIDTVILPAASVGAAEATAQPTKVAAWLQNVLPTQDGLVPLAVLYLLTVFGAAGVLYAQTLWLRVTGQRIITRVRADVFDHVQTLGLAYFDKNPIGRIVTRVTNDVETLNEMYTSVLVNLFRDVFFIAGAGIVLWNLNSRLALITFAALPLVVLTAGIFRRFSRAAWRTMRARLAHINATLSETFSGMRLIQVFTRESESAAEFKEINDGFFDASLRLIRVFSVFGPLLDMLTAGTIALVVWVGGGSVLDGAITLGTLYAVTAYVRRLFEPINALAEKYNIMQSALASAERIGQLMATEPDVQDPPGVSVGASALLQGKADAESGEGETDDEPRASGPDSLSPGGTRPGTPAVIFDDVWFAYTPGEWVLRGISFQVMPGETVAFVGHTGAGKSTIMNLLPRFYDVQKGSIRVRGVDVREMTQAELRRRVGIVMQDVFLFSGDVSFNIHLGAATLSRADVEHAAGLVGADTFVRRLPGGYDEPVVERGLSLSAGQRQLISFARALAYDPEILVLDEATASVDSETEATLQHAIKTVAHDRTTLIVAHRLSTIQDADRIHVLDAGKIVESGTHAELLELDGLYRALWRLQFQGRG